MSDRRERIDDFPTAMLGVLEQHAATQWNALPAEITKISQTATQLTIECQPTIRCKFNHKDGSFTWVSLPVLVDVPVVFPSGGGFILTFPLKVGDEVLVIFADRCIDAWWQNGGVQNQIEFRTHDLSDGFALPGPRSQAKLPDPIDMDKVVLRNDANDTSISIDENKVIRMESPVRVEIAVPVLQINANTIQSTGDWSHSGDFKPAGGVLEHNGVNVGDDHVHSGVTPGGANTGGPQ